MPDQDPYDPRIYDDPNFRTQGEQLGAGLTEPENLLRVRKWYVSASQEIIARAVEYLIRMAGTTAVWFAKRIMSGEDRAEPVFRDLTNAAIQDLTGAAPGSGHGSIGRTLMDSLAGGAGAAPGGTLAPSTKGAEAYMEMVMKLALEGYIEGGITSVLSAGYLDKFTELDDILADVLGLGRMTRAVMRPLMTAKVITPMQWHVNQQYRPELLSLGAAIEAHLAGRLTREQLQEELTRQGWSDDRIVNHVENARKRLPFADLVYQHFRGVLSDTDVIGRAAALGYDATTARELLDVETSKRRDRWRDPILDAAVAAFIAREIEEPELRRLVEANAPSYEEAQFIVLAATTRRGYRRSKLAASEVRRLVVKRVLSVTDYRRALEREGLGPEGVAALELELRMDLDDKNDRDKALAEQQRERILEEEARAADKAARDAELAERKALPALNEYRRAYVRGLITRDRFADAIAREKFGITTDDLVVLLEDADVDRAAALERLEAAAAAAARKPDPSLPLEKYETSVLRGILTLEQYARELVARGYDDDEQRVLVATLEDRQAQQAEATAERTAAAERAEVKSVSLPDFERAVRLGLRSTGDYGAFLDQVGTPEVGKALILDLLDAQLAADVVTRETREAREAAAAEKGISLAQRRRAVVAGVADVIEYQAALQEAGWPADDQLLELALLDVELDEASASRARRDQVAADHEAARLKREAAAAEQAEKDATPPPAPTLSLSQLERAVKLNLLPPAALREELAAKGYSPEDAELVVALVVASVPDTRDAEARELEIANELATKSISLADLQRAVLRGFRTVAQYGQELAARGYGVDDVRLLEQLLEDRVALEHERIRKQLEARLGKTEGAPGLAEILAAVDAGALDVATLVQVLEHFGVDGTTALLFARMLGVFGTEP